MQLHRLLSLPLLGICGIAITLPLSIGSVAYADSQFNDNQHTSANNQPIIKWYRYYNDKGEPSLSTTITEAHLRYGYEALDRNMQVIKRTAPFSTEQYSKDKMRRDAAYQQQQADLTLQRTYGSSSQAQIKRDKTLSDLAARKSYLSSQLKQMQETQERYITEAANLERQKKPVSTYIRSNIQDNQKNMQNVQQNILALSQQEQQTRDTYQQVIKRLSQLEQH